MELQQTGIWILCGALLALSVVAFFKSGHPLKAFLISAVGGVAALFCVSLLKDFTGTALAINEVTLSVSAVGGIPGVILLLCTRLILG